MAAPWEKVNPDNAVDRLPQPFRAIAKILEDVLLAVDERIDEFERQRRSEEYEFALPQAVPSGVIMVPGAVTCASVEPRGMTRLALGTSGGEAWLVDCKTQAVVAQRRAFGDDEAVSCVALCSDGKYAPRPPPPGQEKPSVHWPHVKIFVAGRTTPRIFAFDVRRHAYGVLLEPACAIHIPPRPDAGGAPPPTAGDEAQPRPLVEQLHTRGADDGIWVVALMWDRTIRVYFAPLGMPEERDSESGPVAEGKHAQTITEGDEDAEEDGGTGGGGEGGDEFNVQVKTATYCIALPSLALLPGLPEPGLDSICITAAALRANSRSIAVGTSARQVPLSIMVSSTESHLLFGYSVRAPAPLAAPADMEMEGLFKQVMPAVGVPREEPKAEQKLLPRRRWELPAQVTASAASPDGTLFAAGGAKGSLALIDIARGMSLRMMLAGHYSEVTVVTFHRSDVLVSAGADAWIHHYHTGTGEILARFQCAPPLPPRPAEGEQGRRRVAGAAAAQTLPLAMTVDAAGGMRLMDLRRGKKIARVVHTEAGGGDTNAPPFSESNERPPEEAWPRSIFATATSFCVLCSVLPEEVGETEEGVRPRDSVEGGGGAAGSNNGEEDSEERDSLMVDRSWLVFFDFCSILRVAYPGLSSRAARGLGALIACFNNMSTEQANQGIVEDVPDIPALPSGGVSGNMTQMPNAPGSTVLRGQTQADPVVTGKLTAENLRRIGGHSGTVADITMGPRRSSMNLISELNDGGGSGSPTRTKKHSHAPENWQVSVKKAFRDGLSDKEVRQRRMQQRLEHIRKVLEGGDDDA